MQPLVDKSGPVQYCLSPAGRGAPGSYIFSASVGTRANASTLVRYFHDRGWRKIALITSTDATGQDFDKAVDDVLASPEGKSMSVVAREHFNPTDLSVSAQIARIKAAGPQALLTFTTGTPLGTVLRGIQESGMAIPVSAAAGNLLYPQMQQYKALLPEQLYFAATRGVAPDLRLRPGPIQDAPKSVLSNIEGGGYALRLWIHADLGSGAARHFRAACRGTGCVRRAIAQLALEFAWLGRHRWTVRLPRRIAKRLEHERDGHLSLGPGPQCVCRVERRGGSRPVVNYASHINAVDGTISREIFVNDEIYRAEIEQLFTRAWLFIGHESQIPNAGDFFQSRMGEESVLLTRDREMKVHVFLNTCRHRGMKVCRYDEGNTPLLTCPYHAWSYTLGR